MKKKNYAFTLAEVLITLTIIGVVAAMTIPTLSKNMQRKQNAVKLKKTISVLNQVVKMGIANYDMDWSCTGNFTVNGTSLPCRQAIIESSLNNFTKQTLSSSDIYKIYKSLQFARYHITEYRTIYQLSDGVRIYMLNSSSESCTASNFVSTYNKVGESGYYPTNPYEFISRCGAFIDVNGDAGPNKLAACSTGSSSTITPGGGGTFSGKSGTESYTFIPANNPTNLNASSDCIVEPKNMNDMFRVVFLDDRVIPYDSATAYVLRTNK